MSWTESIRRHRLTNVAYRKRGSRKRREVSHHRAGGRDGYWIHFKAPKPAGPAA